MCAYWKSIIAYYNQLVRERGILGYRKEVKIYNINIPRLLSKVKFDVGNIPIKKKKTRTAIHL